MVTKVYKDSGHDESKIKVPLALHTFVAETSEEAERISKKHVNLYLNTRQYGNSAQFEDLESKEQLLIGTPEQVIARLKQYEEAGCDHVMMLMNFGGIPNEEVMKSMKLIAEKVMPAFEQSNQKVNVG